MSLRNRILVICLWLSVFAVSSWVGGTLYQMLVVVPLWSASPPESVKAFFENTEYNRTIFNFFGPPFMLARNLPLLAALAAGWPLRSHRRALQIAVACFTIFGVLFTLLVVYPINAVLFDQAGGDRSAAEIRALADAWIWRDRLRFAVGLVGFVALLRAFRLPVPGETATTGPAV